MQPRSHNLFRLGLALAILPFSFLSVFALQYERPTLSVKLVRLDRRFDQLVPQDARVEKIADGFA